MCICVYSIFLFCLLKTIIYSVNKIILHTHKAKIVERFQGKNKADLGITNKFAVMSSYVVANK